MSDPAPTERVLVSFRQDLDGEWIGELACGHHQHVRHSPPLQPNEWVLSGEGRADRLGTRLRCRLCDQMMLPERATFVRTSAIFDDGSMPQALARSHRLGRTTWGVLKVLQGRLNFVVELNPRLEVVVDENTSLAIPPGIAHEVHVVGPVRFTIDFYSITNLAESDASSTIDH